MTRLSLLGMARIQSTRGVRDTRGFPAVRRDAAASLTTHHFARSRPSCLTLGRFLAAATPQQNEEPRECRSKNDSKHEEGNAD